jgi:4,5-dihydroxyphthalate decarboxylase
MSAPPRAFYEENSPVTRLFPNFREVEEEYAARVGFWPCFHIIGLRASVVEDHPWVAQSLVAAFEEARKLAAERRQTLADATPWILEEFEHAARLFGSHWQDHGVEPNRSAIATLCEEAYAQGIIPSLVSPSSVFADFERAVAAGSA